MIFYASLSHLMLSTQKSYNAMPAEVHLPETEQREAFLANIKWNEPLARPIKMKKIGFIIFFFSKLFYQYLFCTVSFLLIKR